MRVCPDTTCWIARLLDPDRGHRVDDRRADVFLTTIVLQELWAGARTPEQRAYAERVYHLARQHRRLLTPPAAAWILSGQALRLLAQRHRFSSARLHALRNDALLAATALVHRAAVLTSDRKDFDRIAEVLPVRVVAAGG